MNQTRESHLQDEIAGFHRRLNGVAVYGTEPVLLLDLMRFPRDAEALAEGFHEHSGFRVCEDDSQAAATRATRKMELLLGECDLHVDFSRSRNLLFAVPVDSVVLNRLLPLHSLLQQLAVVHHYS